MDFRAIDTCVRAALAVLLLALAACSSGPPVSDWERALSEAPRIEHPAVPFEDREGRLIGLVEDLVIEDRNDGSPYDFNVVVDLVVDSTGRIYVHNSEKGRLEVFSADGAILGHLPIAGWETPTLREFYLAIDDDDVIYIGDWDAYRIRRFRVDGTELPSIGPKMNRPSGLAVRGGRVIVAARGDNVLRVVDLSKEE